MSKLRYFGRWYGQEVIMQCDFLNCVHKPESCQGDPYKKGCTFQVRPDGPYQEYTTV